MEKKMTKRLNFYASSSTRWFECPGSLYLEAVLPPPEPSIYAVEGRIAHTLIENFLKLLRIKPCNNSINIFTAHSFFQTYKQANINNIIEDKGFKIRLKESFFDAIYSYIEYVFLKAVYHLEFLEDIKIEEKFSIFERQDFRAKLDAYFLKDQTGYIFDFKFGSGLKVFANDNQMKIYALGLFLQHDLKTIDIHIVQPRYSGGSPYSVHTYTKKELIEFKKELENILERIDNGDDSFKAGKHCRFCRANKGCPLLKKKMMEEFKYDLITPAEYSTILPALDGFEMQIKKVREMATKYLKDGGQIKGYELGYAKYKRVWKMPDEKIIEVLHPLHKEKIYNPATLKTVPQMEKIVKNKKELEPFITHVSEGQKKIKRCKSEAKKIINMFKE
jgi:hypothetical protein